MNIVVRLAGVEFVRDVPKQEINFGHTKSLSSQIFIKKIKTSENACCHIYTCIVYSNLATGQ